MKIGKVYSTEYRNLIVSAEADGTMPSPFNGIVRPCWKMTLTRIDNPALTTSIRVNPNGCYSYPARRALLMTLMILCCRAFDALRDEARYKRKKLYYTMGQSDKGYEYCAAVRDSLREVMGDMNEVAKLKMALHEDAPNTPWEDEPEDEADTSAPAHD